MFDEVVVLARPREGGPAHAAVDAPTAAAHALRLFDRLHDDVGAVEIGDVIAESGFEVILGLILDSFGTENESQAATT